jgi:TonB-dependent receptor-like protein/carboxypeptidase family protein
MHSGSRVIAFAAVGVLGVLCAAPAIAQGVPQVQAVTHLASLAPGAIQGIVQDEKGAPVVGAMVSALGSSTAFAMTDRGGRFEMRTLSPGPYLIRAHLAGFIASRGQLVDVRPSTRVSSSIALRRVGTLATSSPSYPILAAGVGGGLQESGEQPADTTEAGSATVDDDHGEVAWRLRHARRGILKDVVVPDEIIVGDTPPDTNVFGDPGFLGRGASAARSTVANLFGAAPFSGQLNLLTTGSFDTPQQLFTSNNFERSVAYLALSAPVGEHADWTARAALTQGDIASWIVAGEYTTRAPARHRYDLGLLYSTQRYDGGNFAARRGVTDGSRNAGAIYGFDTFSITPALTLTYGGRYARYDYLEDRSLLSPRVVLTLQPAEHFRVSTMISRREVAPGAEEFMPRLESGIWMPPQRTFSSLLYGQSLEAERTNHVEVEVERDLASSTVSVRAFRQHVSDQLITLFGVDMPGAPAAHLGHYFVHNGGDVQASGLSAGLRTAIASRVHGAVEYSVTHAQWEPSSGLAYMVFFAPSAMRTASEHIHDVSTSVETAVPETSTRVLVLYRVSNGFAHPGSVMTQGVSSPTSDRPQLDARFDVQVRQSLPFMDFSSAKWEMLLAVRNFFRDAAADQSVYDELLVVRPPKRIVGGLTLKF